MLSVQYFSISICILGDGTHVGVAIRLLNRDDLKLTRPDTEEIVPQETKRYNRVGCIRMLTALTKYVAKCNFGAS